RVTAGGFLASGWPWTGAAVCSANGNQDAPGIVSDGSGGAFIAWLDSRYGEGEEVFAQHITAVGTAAAGWPTDSLRICEMQSDAGITRYGRLRSPQRYLSMSSDGGGGAYLTWRSLGGGILIRAQHLLPDGSLAPGWPVEGLTVCNAQGDRAAPSVVA